VFKAANTELEYNTIAVPGAVQSFIYTFHGTIQINVAVHPEGPINVAVHPEGPTNVAVHPEGPTNVAVHPEGPINTNLIV
jgi:hypothetical protein